MAQPDLKFFFVMTIFMHQFVRYDLHMECEQRSQVFANTITLDGLGSGLDGLIFCAWELQKDQWWKIELVEYSPAPNL